MYKIFNKKNATALIVFFVLMIVVYLYFSPYIFNQPQIDPELVPVKEALKELQSDEEFKKMDKEKQDEAIDAILDQIPDSYKKLKRQYKIATGTVPDIKFYGRVIDQYNQPVVGASIYFEGTNQFLLTGGGRGQVYTDSEGYFAINGGGVELVLGKITLDGIEYAYPRDGGNNSRNEFRERDLSKHFTNHDDPTGRYPNLHDYESKENPYIIQAWRLGEYEGALLGGGSFGLESGKTYTFNLTDPDRMKRINEGVHNGDLHITCTRHHIMQTTTDYGDWSFSIVPVNGGIQETDDLFMLMAPADGYKASINIEMNTSSENYQPQLLNKSYFFTSDNGKTFGSLFVHFGAYTNMENTCGLNISAKVNHTGSRSLELKHSKYD